MSRSPIRLIALALAASATAAQAQRPSARPARLLTQYAVDHWDDRAGLPQNSVQAMAQTRDGYLWLGTQSGVVRFDGVRFTTFGREQGPAMAHPYVWALAPDPDGSLWIGTEETGVIHLKDGRFTAYRAAQGLPSEWVNALVHDGRGTLWIGTMDHGVARMRGGRIESIDSTRIPGHAVNALARDARGVVWAATERGVTAIDGGRFRTFAAGDGLLSSVALAVIPARAGGVWVGTPREVARIDSGRVVARYGAESGLTGPARRLAEDAEGALWIGGAAGMMRLAGGRISPVPRSMLPETTVDALLADREGHLWIGTEGMGLHRFSDSPIVPFGALEGLPSDAVFPVLQDRSGAIWAGLAEAGVARIDGAAVKHFTTAGGSLAYDFAFSLAQDSAGAIWIGSPVGVTRMQDGVSTHYGAADGIPRPTLVRAILADRRGRIWLGTAAGVVRFRPGPPVTFTTADGLAPGFVTTLFEDRDGAIWAGTRHGLSRIAPGPVTSFTRRDGLPDGDVAAIVRASDGALWMATGAGLARLDGRRITTFTSADGLCDDELHSLVDGGGGRLWLSANRGVFSLSLAELDSRPGGRKPRLACTLDGRAEGMRNRETNGAVNPAGLRLRDGRVLFPTMGGLAFIDPERLTRRLPAPPVAIEEVVADGRTLPAGGVVPAGAREVEVHFTALSFHAPEKIQFRYRLRGFTDDDWTDAGTRRTAFFTRIAPGRYRLEVEARHPGGEWSPATPVSLRVLPLVHETWWFRSLAAIVAAVLVSLAYRRRIAALKARERELLAVVEERTRAEARYRDLFDNASDAVLITDATGRVTALNRKAQEITGLSSDGAVGMELRRLLADDAVAAAWLAGTGDTARTVEIVAADGARIPVEVSTRVVRDGGRAAGTQAVARDVRERVELERQVREAQKMEAVGRLAGGVAHDFNNLLTIIQGGSELVMADLPRNDPMREDVAMVLHASERAAGLTRQLLAFSRRQVNQPRRVDVNELVTGIEPMLRRLIGEDIRVTSSVCAGPAWVMADPGQLEQVLVNLAVNARDAMPNGGSITLRTGILAECDCADAPLGTQSGPCVVLSVTDTGVGMDAATQARIFEPFFTTKDQGKGTGLGLSTVYGIVRQAGGTVQCASRPGHGTTFRVRLPFTGQAAAAPADDDAGTAAGAGTETVLLVEDEAPVRAMAARILRRHGYQVLETGSGDEALRVARAHRSPVHLLLTDVVMPHMSGRVLAEQLAAAHPAIRVLYMSGYTDDEILRRGLLHPGVRYLQKPFTVDGLARAVRDLLDEAAPDRGWHVGDAATTSTAFGLWAMDA